MHYLYFININFKLVFIPLFLNEGVYSFKEINEPHIIGGVFIDGKKAYINNENLTEIENYSQNSNVWKSFIQPNDFSASGRSFDILDSEISFKNVTIV